MSIRRGSSILVRPAACLLSAGLIFITTPSTASAQEGDSDKPVIAGVVPNPPVAAVDMFLKIDGIDGEASDEAHSNWIDVLSVDWGAMQTPARANLAPPQRDAVRQRPGRVKYGDITLTKSYDKSSPKLVEACAKGTHIPSIVLELTTSEADGSRYMRVELQDVIISSYGIDATGDRPMESISLNFAKVKTTYIPQNERGRLDSGWRVEEVKVDR